MPEWDEFLPCKSRAQPGSEWKIPIKAQFDQKTSDERTQIRADITVSLKERCKEAQLLLTEISQSQSFPPVDVLNNHLSALVQTHKEWSYYLFLLDGLPLVDDSATLLRSHKNVEDSTQRTAKGLYEVFINARFKVDQELVEIIQEDGLLRIGDLMSRGEPEKESSHVQTDHTFINSQTTSLDATGQTSQPFNRSLNDASRFGAVGTPMRSSSRDAITTGAMTLDHTTTDFRNLQGGFSALGQFRVPRDTHIRNVSMYTPPGAQAHAENYMSSFRQSNLASRRSVRPSRNFGQAETAADIHTAAMGEDGIDYEDDGEVGFRVPTAAGRDDAAAGNLQNMNRRSGNGGRNQGYNEPSHELISMWSQSLASQFCITNILSRRFDGSETEWPEFKLLWIKADTQMAVLGFQKAQRFWELKKVLAGSALQYVKALPPGEDESYTLAISILYEVYDETQSRLRHTIKALISMQIAGPTYNDRQKLHAQLVVYKQSLMALKLSPADTLLAIEIALIESKLDSEWKKGWVRFAEKRRDNTTPLGYNLSFWDMLGFLHKNMKEQNRIKNIIEMPGLKRTEHVKKGHANVALQGEGEEEEEEQEELEGDTYAIPAGVPPKRPFRKPSSAPKPFKKSSPTFRPQNKSKFGAPKKPQTENRDAGNKQPCPFCKQNKPSHSFITSCKAFKAMKADEVKSTCAQKRLCYICFTDHRTADCTAPKRIRCKCGQPHNFKLHDCFSKGNTFKPRQTGRTYANDGEITTDSE